MSTAGAGDPLVTRLRAAGCVFAEDEAAVLRSSARDESHLEELLVRRLAGEPLEQVVGWVDFHGLRLRLEPGVFVPRRRTEALVDEAVALLGALADPLVVDLCCGSGAVGAAVSAALAKRGRTARVVAADLDPAAVRCARTNLPGPVFQGDLFDPLPRALSGRVDVICAHVPYVPTAALGSLPVEAREHEPALALDGGADGLRVLARVAAGSAAWLRPGGHLLTETSRAQAPAAEAILAAAGLAARTVRDDDRGSTVLVGTRPGRRPPATSGPRTTGSHLSPSSHRPGGTR